MNGPGDRGPNDDVDYQAFVASAADVNMVETLDGRCRYASPACQRLFGWAPEDLEGQLVEGFVHPDDLAALQRARAEYPDVEFVSTRFRFLCRDGAYRWIESVSNVVETADSWLVVSALRDITERQQYEADLQVRAHTDPLTGVANRIVLMDRVQQALRRLDRGGGGLAVLYLDLDRFKIINDSLGHHVGDQMLMAVAERISDHLRPADTLARPGGDEFVVVADGMPERSTAVELGERIVEAVRGGIEIDGEAHGCTLSAGLAWTTESQRNAPDLLREADLALYRAKDRGRDRLEVFDEALRTTAAGRLTTERMLRVAIDEGRVVVEYQPVIDLRAGRPVSVEALVRIRGKDTALVLPDSFLQVAEESGMLAEIDMLVLADAVNRASRWRSAHTATGMIDVSVNLTARHLADTAFPRAALDLLDLVGLPPESLQLELTERTLIDAPTSAIVALRALREVGVQVGLDDFGTGYSSLSCLRQFPLDFVKIDRSFTHDLEVGSTERSLVSAVIGVAHALDLQVVAEGVETDVQRQLLEDFECDRAQGFLFAPPSSADVVSELLTRSERS